MVQLRECHLTLKEGLKLRMANPQFRKGTSTLLPDPPVFELSMKLPTKQ